MGYNFGVIGSRQAVVSSILLLPWSSALVLILDINRPRQGGVTISLTPIEWTLESFGQRR